MYGGSGQGRDRGGGKGNGRVGGRGGKVQSHKMKKGESVWVADVLDHTCDDEVVYEATVARGAKLDKKELDKYGDGEEDGDWYWLQFVDSESGQKSKYAYPLLRIFFDREDAFRDMIA